MLVSAASRDARVLFKIALQNPRPKAPPIVRKKLRAPVTTARSFFGDVAWAATSATIRQSSKGDVLVWKVKPIPKPSRMRYPIILPRDISGENVVCNPNPRVHNANPPIMQGL